MRSLAVKLILAFLAVGLIGAALVAAFAGQTTASEFGQFMSVQTREDLADQFASYYREAGGWAGLEDSLPSGGMMGGRGMMGSGGMHGTGPGGPFALADASGRVIVSGAGHPLGEQLPGAELSQGTPVQVDGQTVGLLIEGRGAFGMMTSPAGAEFLDRVNRGLILAALGATAAAVLIGIVIANRLTRPVREMTSATHAVAEGHLGQQVPVRSNDELGELAASFNQMSADLARARDQRRQMTADIAHDLRTPLSVILGHAEALRDGVIAPSHAELDLIHDEATRLNRLVDDLRTLSLAEAGELTMTRRKVNPRTLLDRAAAAQAPRAQQQKVSLHTDIAPNVPEVEVDPDRMTQVLGNLLDNALRYTPAGGSITLSAVVNPAARGVRLSVRDTGPGIAPDDLPHVFDRFYRADKSRQRDRGGSGLGLAIAKSIVESHGGRIGVESTPGESTTFIAELPEAK